MRLLRVLWLLLVLRGGKGFVLRRRGDFFVGHDFLLAELVGVLFCSWGEREEGVG